MPIAELKRNVEAKMDQTIAAFKGSLTKIRTGRASPALLDTVQVDYYGALVPISQVANVSLLDARTVSVQPWEKGLGAKIEKAIRESDLGLNPRSATCVVMPMTQSKRLSKTNSHLRTSKNAQRPTLKRSPIDTSWSSTNSWQPKNKRSWRSSRPRLCACAA